MTPLEAFIARLRGSKEFAEEVVYHRSIPRQDPVFLEPRNPLAEPLLRYLRAVGVSRLYRHQAEALDLAHKGADILVATPTSSGKTLVYTLPVLAELLQAPESVSALFVFPLKALEQDQWRVLRHAQEFLGSSLEFRAAVYDGDTPPNQRKRIRARPPHILITNPDMLHLGILAYHGAWKRFFRNLRFVVIDEVHTYRGIFGSHMAQVIRRLQRITDLYGSRPAYMLSSATIANPREFSQRLVGRRFEVIRESGAPRPARHVLFINPLTSAAFTAARLLIRALREGLKTIVFAKSRMVTELIHMRVKEMAPEFSERISSYRAGFLPEERRKIEAEMSAGKLMGVISTSALEMGIDIGGLDACILAGYPGTIMSTWQRGGRVGRQDRDALIALIAQPDALDQYFMTHPEDFFERGYEPAVVDPENPEVVKAHLPCAAAEEPLHAQDREFPLERYGDLYAELEAEGVLHRHEGSARWFPRDSRPHRYVNIRSVGRTFTIVHADTRQAVGSAEGIRAFRECHPGAVYLHRARQYEVIRMDIERSNIFARPVEVPYFTRSRSEKETEILEVLRSRPCRNFLIKQGRLRVTERVVGYEKRKIRGQELLGTYELDLPEQVFETVGIWLEIEPAIRNRVEAAGRHFMGGIHALEHAAIAMFPLLALCDRDDVGGISYPFHLQIGKGAVFLYDGYPGGVGLMEKGFERIDELLEKTSELVSSCGCEEGCPSCIHSPKCGSGNKPLDKRACLICLDLLLGREVLAPEEKEVEAGPGGGREEEDAVPEEQPRVAYLDLETQRSFEEVGGWGNKHLMRVAVGVLYDEREGRFYDFGEEKVGELIRRLGSYDLVVGFNIKRFDYEVLKAYTGVDLGRIPTFDILEYVHRALGFRVSLDGLAGATLGTRKSGNGLQAIEWFRKGDLAKVTAYCRKDVELTRHLFRFGLEKGYLMFTDRQGARTRLPVRWELGRLVREARGQAEMGEGSRLR